MAEKELEAAIDEINYDQYWRTEFSKWLSYLLRHGAEDARGIKMRSDGYVPIAQILRQQKAKNWELTELHIRAETKINEKQRFQIETIDGVPMIRASQGHTMKSVETEELLEKI